MNNVGKDLKMPLICVWGTVENHEKPQLGSQCPVEIRTVHFSEYHLKSVNRYSNPRGRYAIRDHENIVWTLGKHAVVRAAESVRSVMRLSDRNPFACLG